MPGRDRSGPMGMGAMTGRGAGLCAGNDNPAVTNSVAGRGLGRGLALGRNQGGFGGGRRGGRCGLGFAGRFVQQGGSLIQGDEKELLSNRERALQMELDTVKSRISVMESESAE